RHVPNETLRIAAVELARRALAHTSCVTAAHPEGYLSGPSCVEGRGLASLNQVVCALRFFYGVTLWPGDDPERIVYARAPRKLPTVLSGDEVVAFLVSVSSLKARVALTTAYAPAFGFPKSRC